MRWTLVLMLAAACDGDSRWGGTQIGEEGDCISIGSRVHLVDASGAPTSGIVEWSVDGELRWRRACRGTCHSEGMVPSGPVRVTAYVGGEVAEADVELGTIDGSRHEGCTIGTVDSTFVFDAVPGVLDECDTVVEAGGEATPIGSVTGTLDGEPLSFALYGDGVQLGQAIQVGCTAPTYALWQVAEPGAQGLLVQFILDDAGSVAPVVELFHQGQWYSNLAVAWPSEATITDVTVEATAAEWAVEGTVRGQLSDGSDLHDLDLEFATATVYLPPDGPSGEDGG